MVSQLTMAERQWAMIILLGVAILGLAMTAAGRDDPIAIHGLLVMAVSVGLIFVVNSGYFEPEPAEDRRSSSPVAAHLGPSQ